MVLCVAGEAKPDVIERHQEPQKLPRDIPQTCIRTMRGSAGTSYLCFTHTIIDLCFPLSYASAGGVCLQCCHSGDQSCTGSAVRQRYRPHCTSSRILCGRTWQHQAPTVILRHDNVLVPAHTSSKAMLTARLFMPHCKTSTRCQTIKLTFKI